MNMEWETHMACDFNCLLDTAGHLKVTGRHVHCKCGSVLEMVQDGVIVTTGSDVWLIEQRQF